MMSWAILFAGVLLILGALALLLSHEARQIEILTGEETDEESRALRNAGLVLAVVALVLVAGAWAREAQAAPRARSVAECSSLWSASLIARGMAMEKLPIETARRVIWDIFDTHDATTRALTEAVIAGAFSLPFEPDETPFAFAVKLQAACRANGGDLTPFLGTGV